MKKLLSLLSLWFCGMVLFAQENTAQQNEYGGKHVDMFASLRPEDAKFHIYAPPFKAKAVYTKMEDAKCLTPEELLESMSSETNQLGAVVCRLKSENLAILLSGDLNTPDDAPDFMKKLKADTMGDQGVFDSENMFGIIMTMSKANKTNELLLLIDKSNP